MKMSNVFCVIAAFLMLGFSLPSVAEDDDTPDIGQLRANAEKGDADAEYQLGSLYQKGENITQSDSEAVKWFRKAAYKKNADAQFSLGFAYRGGFGVSKDLIASYMWFDLAATAGNASAVSLRKDVSLDMTNEQIAEAQKLAHDWQPRFDNP